MNVSKNAGNELEGCEEAREAFSKLAFTIGPGVALATRTAVNDTQE